MAIILKVFFFSGSNSIFKSSGKKYGQNLLFCNSNMFIVFFLYVPLWIEAHSAIFRYRNFVNIFKYANRWLDELKREKKNYVNYNW